MSVGAFDALDRVLGSQCQSHGRGQSKRESCGCGYDNGADSRKSLHVRKLNLAGGRHKTFDEIS